MQKPSFKFSFSMQGKIWQSVLDSSEGMLVLEIRDPENHHISYTSINLKTGQEKGPFLIAEADWWTTIINLNHPFLLLEQYSDPQDPIGKDLIVYNLVERRVIKKAKQFQFDKYTDGKIIGHAAGRREAMKEIVIPGVRSGVKSMEHGVKLERPVFYSPKSDGMKVVLEYLDLGPEGFGCEYLERADYIIISYYLRCNRKFQRKLLVIKGDDELYHQIQDDNLEGFASGAFFIFNDLLIFIKNGNQINGIEI